MSDEPTNSQPAGGSAVVTEKEPSSFRLIMTLGLAGFFGGLIMVAAYLFTKPLIEANKAAAIEKAIYKVLPKITSFKTLELKNGSLQPFDAAAAAKNAATAEPPKLIYLGLNKAGEPVGYAVLGDEIGFADVITVIIGYDPVKKTIIGFEVLECKETPGLGDKIIKDEGFRNNFKSLLTDPDIGFAKKGEKTKENQVEAITGATISSKAVIRLLNKAMTEWKGPAEKYLKENNYTNTAATK